MGNATPDCSGWATYYDVPCADGRTIMRGAFSHQRERVPLLFMHEHKNIGGVIGHAELDPRPEGVWADLYFNPDIEAGRNAKALVSHGDLNSLSIFANNLTQIGGNVKHGTIKELSLVIAGANRGAKIEYVPNLSHSEFGGENDEESEFNCVIHSDVEWVFPGNEQEEATPEPTEEPVIEHAEPEEPAEEKEEVKENKHMADMSVMDIYNNMDEDQKTAVQYMIGAALEDAEGEAEEMAHNLFETYGYPEEMGEDYLEHDGFAAVDIDGFMNDVQRDCPSMGLRDAMLQHAAEYGIEDIDLLFPEARVINGQTPEMIQRDQGWVTTVLNGIHKWPTARVKMLYADITEDEARAKGYIKGDFKMEEVLTLLKRSVEPTTIYKKQRFDRDDMIDVNSNFDMIPWIKAEMRGQLNEEFARAIMFGDGRPTYARDHIKDDRIIPIINDADLFVLRYGIAGDAESDAFAKAFIKGCVKSRKGYTGQGGNLVLFVSESLLTNMLLLEDSTGRILYDTEEKLATAMRVKKIVTVPQMENGNIKDKDNKSVYGVILNLDDYATGTDKGGEINTFEDFNIDYNQMVYLMETRASGALRNPFSAMVLRAADTTGSQSPALKEAMAPFRKNATAPAHQ